MTILDEILRRDDFSSYSFSDLEKIIDILKTELKSHLYKKNDIIIIQEIQSLNNKILDLENKIKIVKNTNLLYKEKIFKKLTLKERIFGKININNRIDN